MAQPPPPPGYTQPQQPMGYPTQQSAQHTVIVTNPGYAQPINIFRESPVSMACPFCNAQIVTSTSYVTGTLAWLLCGILILLGLWIGCCLIPFCLNGCKDVIHSCPNCNQQVGKFNRM
ncbi:LITAF domain-containing protein-like [Ylistrum balloti]|uniref:LITAF domain-containing protein-like n=1 Tax=Ylistrum balloti TaxID=509963 RepID=UPI00290588D9|nr:LITAF domain-containing protein-like [Ylistrum balloti]